MVDDIWLDIINNYIFSKFILNNIYILKFLNDILFNSFFQFRIVLIISNKLLNYYNMIYNNNLYIISFRTELDCQMSYTLMDLVFQLLCNGELMQGRILRNKITEKNQQRKKFLLSGGSDDIIANYISNTKLEINIIFKCEMN